MSICGKFCIRRRLRFAVTARAVRSPGPWPWCERGPRWCRIVAPWSAKSATAPTEDGVEIAYSVTGEGPPLLRVVGWFTHLEYEWETPFWRAFIEQFSRQYTLVRYDGRGTGLSQRDIDAVSGEGFLKDLEAMVEFTDFLGFINQQLNTKGIPRTSVVSTIAQEVIPAFA